MAGLGREALVAYVRQHMFGPRRGEDEILHDSPADLYTSGVLHPIGADMTDVVEREGDDESGNSSAESGLVEEAVRLTNERLPSSVALSFFVKGPKPKISVRAQAARYSKEGANEWARTQCSEELVEISRNRPEIDLWENAAQIVSQWRKVDDGYLITAALVNRISTSSKASKHEPESCLFQVGMECRAEDGQIDAYPGPENLAVSDEEAELILRYSHSKIYAAGHGCAAEWTGTDDDRTVAVSFMPFVEIPPLVVTEGKGNEILKLARLRDAPTKEIQTELGRFVDDYADWIEKIRSTPVAGGIQAEGARARILGRLDEALSRMRDGVNVLSDPLVEKSFRLAQKAMILQIEHSDGSLGGEVRDLKDAKPMPAMELYGESDATWRPFQLGYILTCLPSIVDSENEHRRTVDLIWAATGAGKTEAYLALAAIAIIHRRLTKGPKSGGTTVITRYTLRLLTAQQFERTSRLVCALERVRLNEPALGDERITIGLWVGQAATPNTFEQANEIAEAIFDSDRPASEQGFQVEKCPWCGVRIIPQKRSRDESHYGIAVTNNSFRIWCPNDSCDFKAGQGLPIQVVDHALYANPPTILIGTVDKFANLAWEDNPGVFFGTIEQLPPSLIIQDELHLLSGPLGTTVGLYEAAIETLCELHGEPPKVLAATATIREAGPQIQALYGRNSALFPPAGIDERDSYFTQVDNDRPGRGYLGVLSPNHTPSTSMVRTCAVLLQAPEEVTLTPEERDAYWTLVAYHNSLRELGKSITFARDDIPAWIHNVASNPDPETHRRLHQDNILELTGNVAGYQIPAAISELQRPADDNRAVSFAACTNMLSVGVDVQRLGLMLVHGQPKTTAEYIQASSRVGRGETPGLVVSHYSSTKPRDRSHYEQFGSYHNALYRWVEPTSVTPFSLQSRDRALAAALVILVRHGCGLSENTQAQEFDPEDSRLLNCIELFHARAKRSDPEEAGATREHLERLTREWDDIKHEHPTRRLWYRAKDPAPSLLRTFTSRWGSWPALNSMRNVDAESPMRLISKYSDGGVTGS